MDLLDTPRVPLAAPEPAAVTMFERLAMDPNVPVEKLEKLIEMHERILRLNAEMAFNAAFSELSPELPTVAKNGKSLNGPYATLEDIIEAVRPVLHRFGFAITHKTTFPAPGKIEVTGILTHRQGHAITTTFEASPDTSGNKNAIQALGSADSYGRRYTTKSLLFPATKDEQRPRDRRPDAAPELEKPKGYDDWFLDLGASADLGRAALEKTWDASKGVYKHYLNKMDRRTWEAIKARAARVSSDHS
jgi:hypothetical protein